MSNSLKHRSASEHVIARNRNQTCTRRIVLFGIADNSLRSVRVAWIRAFALFLLLGLTSGAIAEVRLFRVLGDGKDAVQLRMDIRGRGQRTIVFVHGNPGLLDNFEPLRDALNLNDYTVINWERPGNGEAPRPRGTTIQKQIDWLASMLDQIGVRDAFFVGHSWGGGFSLLYSMQHQRHVKGIVMFGGEAYPDSDLKSGLARYYKSFLGGVTPFAKTIASSKVRKSIKEAFEPQEPTDVGGYAGDRAFNLFRRRSQIKAMDDDERGLQRAYPSSWNNVRVPVCIITGTEDKLVHPDRHARRLFAELPCRHLIELEGVGHMIPQCFPQVAAVLVDHAANMMNATGGLPTVQHLGFGWVRDNPTPARTRLRFLERLVVNDQELIVNLALTTAERNVGFAGVPRESVLDREGLLYAFSKAEVRRFWNKGVAFPVDVAFLDDYGVVLYVTTLRPVPLETPENDIALTSFPEPCRFVIEVPGGYFARQGWGRGTWFRIPTSIYSRATD